MEYITHHRFKAIAMCGGRLNIPYGTKLNAADITLVTQEEKPICYITSENAKRHFARNNDGRGLERGKLTYAIAFAPRERKGTGGRRQRFTDAEIEMLERDYSHWLRPNLDVVLFNDDFFAAEVEDLQKLADKLGIKYKR